jgi:hypothetical protein
MPERPRRVHQYASVALRELSPVVPLLDVRDGQHDPVRVKDSKDRDAHSTLYINPSSHTVPDAPTLRTLRTLRLSRPSMACTASPASLRSSIYAWVEPQNTEAYLTPKEPSPLGFGHPLGKLWERAVGPEMADYLGAMGVKCSSLDPSTSATLTIWLGALLSTLTAGVGVKIAVHCTGILSTNSINDVHVELRELKVFRPSPLPASLSLSPLLSVSPSEAERMTSSPRRRRRRRKPKSWSPSRISPSDQHLMEYVSEKTEFKRDSSQLEVTQCRTEYSKQAFITVLSR